MQYQASDATLQRSCTLTASSQNRVSRFFRGAANSISFAFQVDRLANTPEDVFQARGTTRQQAIRDLISRI